MNQKDYSSYVQTIIEFENELAEYLGQNKSVCCLNSGTAAIHLALILAGVQHDDLVLCQSFTYSATVNPILYQGAKPVFVDSEKETWNMCPDRLEEAIHACIDSGTKPKAIIVVHLYGMPAQIDRIQQLAAAHGICLIEDAAEALGASYKGQACGTFGDFGVLSFNNNKLMSTLGGGALICRTKEQRQRAVYLATHAKSDKPYYHHTEVGYNYRMNALAAALGKAQLSQLTTSLGQREQIHGFYKSIFDKLDGLSLMQIPSADYKSNYWLNCITGDSSDALGVIPKINEALTRENIDSRPLWKPMHLQPVFASYTFYGNEVCEQLFNSGLCLPSGARFVWCGSIKNKDFYFEGN